MEKNTKKIYNNTKMFEETLESVKEHEICQKMKKYDAVTSGSGSYHPIYYKIPLEKNIRHLKRYCTEKTIKYSTLNKMRKISAISKFDDSISVTTKCSVNEKPIKHVTFSTIEIIRVEKYKKYNKGVTIPKKSYAELIKEKKEDESSCTVF